MNSSRPPRTKACLFNREESSIEDSVSDYNRGRRRKSKSCSPSSTNKNKSLRSFESKENSFKKCDSLNSVHSQTPERRQYLSVVLTDLKNLNINSFNSACKEKSTKPFQQRKSKRPKRKSVYLIEAEESQRALRKPAVQSTSEESGQSDFVENINQEINRPKETALFSDDDIEGKQIFCFQSPKKKDLMFKKILEKSNTNTKSKPKEKIELAAHQTPTTPKSAKGKSPRRVKTATPKTPKTLHNTDAVGTPLKLNLKFPRTPTRRNLLPGFQNDTAITPKIIRNKIKKEIALQIASDEYSDFSASQSDYEPSEMSSCSSSSSDSSEESSNSKNAKTSKKQRGVTKIDLPKTRQMPPRTRQRREGDTDYVLRSDNYFSMQNAKKNLTSNHTMQRLKNPQLTDDKLQDMMENISASEAHVKAIRELNMEHCNLFDKWIYYLSEGYNILLYGIGSKRDVVEEFLKHAFEAVDIPCFVVNGYFPGLTVKDVLKSIMVDLLEFSTAPSNVGDAIDAINAHLISRNIEFALTVHNIDGPMLRNDKAQYVFSKLASLKNIYFIASMDHIRAPLFWGSSKLRSFNFSWWDVTTLKSYVEETVNENLSLVHKAGALALSSLKNVFLSLNIKARGIFFIIVKKQISSSKTSHYQGLAYQELYTLARESFLVSSDFALRSQLTEFIDHKLIKMRRTADGGEHLQIPIDNNLLRVFLEQHEEL